MLPQKMQAAAAYKVTRLGSHFLLSHTSHQKGAVALILSR
jgi:hypothetical protein